MYEVYEGKTRFVKTQYTLKNIYMLKQAHHQVKNKTKSTTKQQKGKIRVKKNRIIFFTKSSNCPNNVDIQIIKNAIERYIFAQHPQRPSRKIPLPVFNQIRTKKPQNMFYSE